MDKSVSIIVQPNNNTSTISSGIKLTFSFLCCILPFYGPYDNWRSLVKSLSKSTLSLWQKNVDAFSHLNRLIKWSGSQFELEELYKRIYNKGETIEDNQQVNLKGKRTKLDQPPILILRGYEENDKLFVKFAKKYKFPNFKGFTMEIHNTESYNAEETSDLNQFLKESSPDYIKAFIFSCSNSDCVRVDRFKLGLRAVLPKTIRFISFCNFNLNDKELEDIIEKSTEVYELELKNCKIDLTTEFQLNYETKYTAKLHYIYIQTDCKMKVLSLEETCIQNDDDYLNEDKLIIFVEELSKTHLKNSLSQIAVIDYHFNSRDIWRIFNEREFNIRVI